MTVHKSTTAGFLKRIIFYQIDMCDEIFERFTCLSSILVTWWSFC